MEAATGETQIRISVGEVRVLLHRARLSLRATLEPDLQDEREKTAWISHHAPKWTKTFVDSLQELQQTKEGLEVRETVKFLVESDTIRRNTPNGTSHG